MTRLLPLALLAACTAPDAPDPTRPPTPSAPVGCQLDRDPQSIDELVARVDQLPERSIPCMIASLQRPLDVMAVASLFSAQPGTWWSPRFFLFTDGMVISVVPEGDGAHLLEMGEWVERGRRTRKAELVYPLGDGPPDPYTHLVVDDGTTCGACHTLETPEGPPGQFVSEAIEPTIGSRVPLDDVQAEADACDEAAEPERCAILWAVMGQGDVNDAIWPD